MSFDENSTKHLIQSLQNQIDEMQKKIDRIEQLTEALGHVIMAAINKKGEEHGRDNKE